MRTAPGPTTAATMPTNDTALLIDWRDPVSLCAGLDEVAVYDEALPDDMLYQHFLDAIVHQRPYSTAPPTVPWPNNATYPNVTNASYYDLAEYAPGTELPTPQGKGNNTEGVMVSCKDQLLFAADPRYNASSIEKHGTPYNFNWMDPSYMAGQGQPAERKILTN